MNICIKKKHAKYPINRYAVFFFFYKKISYKILIIFSYKYEVIFSEYFSKYKETPQILAQKLSFTKSSQY